MVVVAIMSVRRAALDSFRAFERGAAAILAKHGGALEHSIVVDEGETDRLKEVHVIRFSDHASFSAYRADRHLAELRHLRDASVIETELMLGEDGPRYGA